MALWLVRPTPDRVVRVRALSWVIALCSWARRFTLTVLLFTQVYKWVPANVLGVTLRWTSIPFRGSSNTPSRFMLRKPELSTGPMGHLGPYRGFYFFTLLIQKGLSLSLSGAFDQRPKVFCKNYTANSLLMASSLQPSHYVKPFCRFYVYSR